MSYINGRHSQGIAFDGAYVRVANYSSDNVTKPKASDYTLLGTFNVGTNPLGVAFDGVNIWVANAVANGTVSKM
jgi:DNA-binding beta-propeller fold protein YncE